MRITSFAFAIALLATPALAEPVAAPSPEPAKEKKICRKDMEKTGSRMGSGRKCKTAAEWAEIDGGGKGVDLQAAQVGTISRTNR